MQEYLPRYDPGHGQIVPSIEERARMTRLNGQCLRRDSVENEGHPFSRQGSKASKLVALDNCGPQKGP